MELQSGKTKKSRFELKQSDNTLSKVNRILEAVFRCGMDSAKIKEESDLLHGICRIIVDIGGYSLAWIGLCSQDEKQNFRPGAKALYDKGYLERWEVIRAIAEDDDGPTWEAIQTVKPCITRNISIDCNDDPAPAEDNSWSR